MNEMEFNARDVMQEALKAENRIRPYIRETPVEFSPFLSQLSDSSVYLKLENIQITGSFKLRGAMNKFLSFDEEERNQGIMTASSGNHGMAFAYVTHLFGAKGTIILPEIADQTKIEALKQYGPEIGLYGDDCIKAEKHARTLAQKRSLAYIPPYNDPQVIGGQATIGIELTRQLDKIDAVLAPVGGGGLIAGIAGYLKSVDNSIDIIGCQPENSCVMYHSVEAGHILDMESLPTISDGSAGGIEEDSITFPICKNYVDEFALLTEQEIIHAILLILKKHYLLIEGAAALSVAALLKHKTKFEGKNTVLILSGAKISLDTLKGIL